MDYSFFFFTHCGPMLCLGNLGYYHCLKCTSPTVLHIFMKNQRTLLCVSYPLISANTRHAYLADSHIASKRLFLIGHHREKWWRNQTHSAGALKNLAGALKNLPGALKNLAIGNKSLAEMVWFRVVTSSMHPMHFNHRLNQVYGKERPG